MALDIVPTEEELLSRLLDIHQFALDCLETGTAVSDLPAYLQDLRGLNIQGREIDHFEARIALMISARALPARALGALRKLRGISLRRKQMDRFAAFEARIQANLGPLRLTGHGYTQRNFADMDHGSIWSHVADLMGALRERNLQVFLNSGTLLGVVRDKRLIDHDDDIDLGVILDADSLQQAIAEWHALGVVLWEMGLIDTNARDIPGLYKLRRVGDVQIDLFASWFEGDRFFVYPHTFGELTRDDVLPLADCPVTGNPIPAAPEKMLALNYGDRWAQPDPYFTFPWHQANARFAAFLDGLAAHKTGQAGQ